LEVIRPAPNIEFMEPVDDIREFYARCRMVLMPSLSEDAGTVCQEATLNGLPCLSTNVGGLLETNRGGLLFMRADTPETWVASIRDLDNRAHYVTVVRSQRDHLAEADHAGSLDLLAQRIKGLAT
jgi:glycosyltransferase involved in cell wall biosynthesis